MIKTIENKLLALRKRKPLVLNLTNFVTMDFMANSLLALGASPIMSVCDEELEELVNVANCININLGTLDEMFINRCFKAVIFAKQYQKPIVLDPVGCGASKIRTTTAQKLLEFADIVRGNASEIIALYDSGGKTRGVDATNTTLEAKEKASLLAKQYGCTVVSTGFVDIITDRTRTAEIHCGSALMSLVTGMGCTLTGVIAAFRSITEDAFESARLATTFFGLCGSLAETRTHHPGTFRTHFIDILHRADLQKMQHFYNE